MNDQLEKDWPVEAEDQARAMQMLTLVMCLFVVVLLGALLGLAGANWWSGHDTLATLVAQLRGTP